MEQPDRSQSPIQLLPAPSARVLPSAVLSVAMHAVLIALVVWAAGRFASRHPASVAARRVHQHTLHFISLMPVPPRPADPPATSRVAHAARHAHHMWRGHAALALAVRMPRVVVLGSEASTPEPDPPIGGLLHVAVGARLGELAREVLPANRMGDGSAAAGADLKVVELRSATATACPVLRRPPGADDEDLTVTAAFEVDSAGMVDPATLRMLELPGQPRTEYGIYSHLFAVTTRVKVDRDLPDVNAPYDSALADDMARHVAELRFRPALRNGRPTRASVLITCQPA